MGLALDILIVIIMIFCIIRGLKRGLIKSIMSTCTVVLAVIAAWILNNPVSDYLYQNFFHSGVTESVKTLINNLIPTGSEKEGLTQLFAEKSTTFTNIFNKFGADFDQIKTNFVEMVETKETSLVEKVSSAIAENAAGIISNIAAFAVVFIVAVVLLNVVTIVLNLIFSTKALSPLNKMGGLLIGILNGAIWAIVIIVAARYAEPTLAEIYPNVFTGNIAETSIILSFINNIWPVAVKTITQK